MRQLNTGQYKKNKTYYKNLSKKDIVKRLGKSWLKKELF